MCEVGGVLCSVFCKFCDLWVTVVCKFDLGRQFVRVGGFLCSVCVVICE